MFVATSCTGLPLPEIPSQKRVWLLITLKTPAGSLECHSKQICVVWGLLIVSERSLINSKPTVSRQNSATRSQCPHKPLHLLWPHSPKHHFPLSTTLSMRSQNVLIASLYLRKPKLRNIAVYSRAWASDKAIDISIEEKRKVMSTKEGLVGAD